jgi:hypothetical protein
VSLEGSIFKEIAFPIIFSNTALSITLPPQSVHLGIYIVVNAVQPEKA